MSPTMFSNNKTLNFNTHIDVHPSGDISLKSSRVFLEIIVGEIIAKSHMKHDCGSLGSTMK